MTDEEIIDNVQYFENKQLVFVSKHYSTKMQFNFKNGDFSVGVVGNILKRPGDQIFLCNGHCILRKDLVEAIPVDSLEMLENKRISEGADSRVSDLNVYTFEAHSGIESQRFDVIHFDPFLAYMLIADKGQWKGEQNLARINPVRSGKFFYTLIQHQEG